MGLSKFEEPTASVAPHAPAAWSVPRWAIWLLVSLLLLAGVAAALAPAVQFAIQRQRAVSLLERGLSWPTPRQSDSLPRVADPQALAAARTALLAAVQLRPLNVSTLRLLGQVYAAQGEWASAVTVLERAAQVEPQNPLAAWELGLAYEQLAQVAQDASDLSLMNQLAAGEPQTPAAAPQTPYCRSGGQVSCSVTVTRVAQHFAGLPEVVGLNARTLIIVPPASQRLTLVVPANRPALSFAVGLDPQARVGLTDGARFQISVETHGSATPVYAQVLDRATLLAGWVPAMADLSPWVDHEVTLVFTTTGGPQTWAGFGNVVLTSPQGAAAALFAPRSRSVAAWRRAGLRPAQFLARAAEASAQGHAADAARWQTRARELTLP